MEHATRIRSFIHSFVARALGVSLLAFGLPAWAVKDSEGGPAVLQLNLQPPVTQIA